MRALLLLAFAAAAAAAPAHDLWLIPPERAKSGDPAVVTVSQGMDFPVSTGAPNASRFARTLVRDPSGGSGTLEALEPEGKTGRLRFTPGKDGLYLVAVETTPKTLAMDAADFNAYLVSDGLPHIFKLRHEENSLNQPAKEQYRKSVTAIVAVGPGRVGDLAKPLGLPLELIPLKNPLTRKVGDTLPIRVLFQGKPLPDANLGNANPGDGDAPRGTARSDARGEALLPIAKTGLMTIRLTHMTRPKTADHEWESFWSTLTFRIDP